MLRKKYENLFTAFSEGIAQVAPEKWTMYERFADHIYIFEARSDDVWIYTIPRLGTTWAQEMIWLICNGLDCEKALNDTIQARFSYFE